MSYWSIANGLHFSDRMHQLSPARSSLTGHLGSTQWAKTIVRRVGVYAGACAISVKATSGRRTIATAKIVEDAQGASTSLLRSKLAASELSLEAPEGLPSKLTAAIP